MKCPKCHSDNPDTSRYCGSCAEALASARQPPDSLTKTLQPPARGISKGNLIAGKYRIVEEIGRGGMGIVYKAEDIKLQRTVALKFLPAQWTSDPEARERFVHEARAASALDHPNICNIHEIEETDDGRMYIAMACYEGASLREKLKRGPLALEETLKITIQIAEGMAAAHAKGIVHRDLKPANIIIVPGGLTKIVDFGLAKLAGQIKLTREGTTVGTVAYMSPEQAEGEAVDQRTDIWSLGVVLYEMLAGLLPFKGDYEKSVIRSILKDQPAHVGRLRKGLPSGLESIVAKALGKRPADRYQTMEELLEDLHAIAEGLKPVRATGGLLHGRVLGLKKIHAYPLLASLIVLTVLAGLFIFPKRSQAFDSIAVLPFVNQSGDPDQDTFCDSVHRELITQLSRIKSIRTVIAKQTMMAFKGTTKKSSEIARELNVEAIISGEAHRAGDNVLINFELIDGRNDKLLGGDSVEGSCRDILILQGEAALAIARKIQSALTPEETRVLSEKKRVDPEAYEHYIKGKALLDQATQAHSDWGKCLTEFESAISLDPAFAAAHAGLALAYDWLGSYMFLPTAEAAAKMLEAASTALRLDPANVDANLVVADYLNLSWDWEACEKEYRQVLESSPNHAGCHAFLAMLLVLTGRGQPGEATLHAEWALKLDPLSYGMTEWIANAYMGLRDYDRGIRLLNKFCLLDAKNPSPHFFLSCLYWRKKMPSEAAAELDKAIELGMDPEPLATAIIHALNGERSRAMELADLVARKGEARLTVGLAMLYAVLGEKDRAFKYLNVAYENRSPMLPSIGTDNLFDNLRDDPRFKVLLRNVGLEK